ncbi:MAG: hypothetical protein R2795_25185 [Saprospiraceae bacterium]
MAHDNTTTAQWLTQARDLIAKDRIDEALGLLRSLLHNSPLLDEIIQQSSRFANIRQHIRLGTVSHAEANLTRNQISHALLELLREIEAQERQQPALQQEIKAAISIVNSKNVVANSHIQAGRDVHNGDNRIAQQTNIETQIIHYSDKKIPRALTAPPSSPKYSSDAKTI